MELPPIAYNAEDVQRLITENHLAKEQLFRFVRERQLQEMMGQLAEARALLNEKPEGHEAQS